MFNIARLTIFAALSALEQDGRQMLVSFASDAEIRAGLPPDLYERIVERAKRDKQSPDALGIGELIDYIDLGDLSALLNRLSSSAHASADLKLFARLLLSLVPTRNRVFHNRPLEPDDLARSVEALETASALQEVVLLHSPALLARLRKEPTFVLGLEIQTHDTEQVFHNLPLPDYDDTSLIGRSSEVEQVLTNLRGPFPIVSIIGEGGVGKTALALHSVYNIIDSSTCAYEAVIWVSLKHQAFGAGGVREVENAISSAVTLYETIDREMAGTASTGGLSAILDFMRVFPTLLVLDNLEAINANEINQLLTGIPSGSKLLITSRIPLGQLELPYKLEPLTPKASVQLMRRCAQLLNLFVLTRADNQQLGKMASDLYHNPLGIRWFVGSVANGADPRTVQKHKSDFLAFCFADMYDRLAEEEKALLRLFFVTRRALSTAEVAYLCDDTGIDYRVALNGLLSTSIVRMGSEPATGRTTYLLTDFAADFLRKFHSVDTPTYKELLSKVQGLTHLEQENAVRRELDELDPRGLLPDPNNRDELICAAYLRRALTASKANNRDSSVALLEKARSVCPDYRDIYKIAGFIFAHFGEIQHADEEYNMALEGDPDSPSLLCLYAGFLLGANSNLEKALELAERAGSLSESTGVRLTRGRARLFCGRYDLALSDFDSVYRTSVLGATKYKRIAADQAAECLRRQAEPFVSKTDPRCVPLLLRGLDYIVTAAYDGVLDRQLSETALEIYTEPALHEGWEQKARHLLPLYKHLSNNSFILSESSDRTVSLFLRALAVRLSAIDRDLAKTFAMLYKKFSDSLTEADAPATQGSLSGRIKARIGARRRFGFIENETGEFYFQAHDLINADFVELNIGQSVEFVAKNSVRGPVATNIWVDPTPTRIALASLLTS